MQSKEEKRAYDAKYWKSPAGKASDAKTHRKRSYGLSDFDINRMSDEHGFSCAICKGGIDAPTTGKRETLHIDHCHRTNKNRGLLCSNCNHGLGKFKDSLGLLRNVQQYLLDRG